MGIQSYLGTPTPSERIVSKYFNKCGNASISITDTMPSNHNYKNNAIHYLLVLLIACSAGDYWTHLTLFQLCNGSLSGLH